MNATAENGVSRCECGSKYWENDRCIDCGQRHDPARHDGATGSQNWYWQADGIFGDVKPTYEEADGQFVFPTFAQARAALARNFDGHAQQYRWAAREARKLRKPKTA